MKVLFDLGLTVDDIKNMLEINPYIPNLDAELIDILKENGCSNTHIKNILMANPLYLNRSKTDILKLIDKLKDLGITHLETTFDTNPWLLNKDVFEIDEFIEGQIKLGLTMDEIVDMIDSEML